MNSPLQIAVAVVECDGRFLVGVRATGAALEGYDEFPGGKVAPGESPREAAVRECREETGIEIDRLELLEPVVRHHYEHGDVEIHFYLARPLIATPPPRPPFRWVQRDELRELRFPEANQLVLARLLG